MQWKSEKKADIARKWIQELKARSDFQSLDLRAKMVTDFIRIQEDNFKKAYVLATKLNLPPPSEPGDLGYQERWFEDRSTSRSPAGQVKRLCHYFDRLYHTLAPLYSTNSGALNSSIPEVTMSTGLETFEEPDLSSSASSSRADGFSLSPSPVSSRSSIESPAVDISYQCPPSSLANNSLTKYIPTYILEDNDPGDEVSRISQPCVSEKAQFTFKFPRTGTAPIPVPVLSSCTEVELAPVSLTKGLSEQFQDLDVMDITNEIAENNVLRSIPSPAMQPSSQTSDNCTLRSKRCSIKSLSPSLQPRDLRQEGLPNVHKAKRHRTDPGAPNLGLAKRNTEFECLGNSTTNLIRRSTYGTAGLITSD